MKHTVEKEVKITLELTKEEFLTLWAALGITSSGNRSKILDNYCYPDDNPSLSQLFYEELNKIREKHLPSEWDKE